METTWPEIEGEPIDGSATNAGAEHRRDAQRQCAVCKETFAKDALIRFVRGPEGWVVADLAEKLPGRGVWILAKRNHIEAGIKRHVFRRGLGSDARVDASLVSEIEFSLARRGLDTLGLARRAGEVVTGFDNVAKQLAATNRTSDEGRSSRKKKSGVLVTAADASLGGDAARLRARAVGAYKVVAFSRGELGRALGRDEVVHALILPGKLAARFFTEVTRLHGFRDLKVDDPGQNCGYGSEVASAI